MFLTSLLLLGTVLAPEGPAASPAAPAPEEPKADPAPSSLKAPFEAVVGDGNEPVVTQACDASRTPSTVAPTSLKCTTWRMEWTHKGKVWGTLQAPSAAALREKKARHLGFVRHWARVFDKPIDPRYDDSGPLVCDQCDPGDARGRWGEGQTFSGLGSARALTSAREGLVEFERVFFERHAGQVAEVARLASERKTASVAKRYAKQLELASADLVAWQAQLDHAELVRSESKVAKVAKAMQTRGAALDKGLETLGKQVATTVSKAHGGAYAEEGSKAAVRPRLDIDFDGRKVIATYRVGEASSVWFEGEVSLDGSIKGRSLMAPPDSKLTCAEHTEACGYRYIPAIIRFSLRAEPRQEVLELWFQRETWVRASPFSRG